MNTPTWIHSWFHRAGRGVLRMVAGRYLALPQSAEPPADTHFRTVLFVVPGGTGVADSLMFCRKDASEALECGTVNVTF